jgi:hypothetical protein
VPLIPGKTPAFSPSRSTEPAACYTFHVLREPPLLSPDQLCQLPPRLQELHGHLLAGCGINHETYEHRVHNANHHKEQLQTEEVPRTIRQALKPAISPGNYQTYIDDTHAIAFDRDTGILLVEAPTRSVASQLDNHFCMTVRRVIANSLHPPRPHRRRRLRGASPRSSATLQDMTAARRNPILGTSPRDPQ